MVRLHEFNTRWWGAPTAIVDDGAFFALPAEARRQALAPFQWVEFKSQLGDGLNLLNLQRTGFFLADMQEELRIALKTGPLSRRSQSLEVRFADAQPFELGDTEFRPFAHERFQHLPGCTEERINARYGQWGRLLIREHPQTCIEMLANGVTQGWFLSQPVPNGLNLTLAMLHREAKISGFLLYEKALAAYAYRGHRIGWSGFSVTNTAVHNIFAKLGAHFASPTGVWLWVREAGLLVT